jgi:endonuclease/exonuclease/phosphatase (EEP) superfamily protein YafD
MTAPPDEQLPLRTRRPVRPWRLAVALLVVVGAAVTMLADLLGLDRHPPFAQLAAFRVPLLGLLVVVAVVAVAAAVRRRRGFTLAAGLLVVALVTAMVVAPRAVATSDPPAPGTRTLTVLSFNTYEGTADVDALAALITTTRPDLIALPESARRFSDKLAPLVPGYRFAPSGDRGRDVNGVTAAVRADLGDVAVQVDRTTNFPSVQLSGAGLGSLRFVAFHSVAPTRGEIPQWIHDLSSLGRWCDDRGGGPVIIAGDFNATLDHSVFRSATQGCTDAAERTGEGLVGTWPTRVPRWMGTQIDHVIFARGVAAETLSVHDIPGSDHRALVTRLRLPT